MAGASPRLPTWKGGRVASPRAAAEAKAHKHKEEALIKRLSLPIGRDILTFSQNQDNNPVYPRSHTCRNNACGGRNQDPACCLVGGHVE